MTSLVLTLALLTTGCQAASVPDAPSPSAPTAPISPNTEAPSTIPDPLPANVTARGVVLATVIIATGNVGSAIEEGLISPEEVDLARKAIAEGTIQEWVDAAEKEKRQQ